MARHQKGAQAQAQTILFIDESGVYPLPSVVRTYAPIGQTPILREWWTHDHLSAISAISPEGKLYFHDQDHAINSEDVVTFLTHLLREVPGRIVVIWDGAPIHPSHLIQEFLYDFALNPGHEPSEPAWRQSEETRALHNLHSETILASGAAKRLHLERLSAYAPELNPGKGLWQQLKGVELRNVCCGDIPQLRGDLRDAVKRVRRKPRLLKGFFLGARL